MHSSGQKEIWEFWPLPGDPTPEERAELLRQAKVDQDIKDNEFAREVLADLKSRGLA